MNGSFHGIEMVIKWIGAGGLRSEKLSTMLHSRQSRLEPKE